MPRLLVGRRVDQMDGVFPQLRGPGVASRSGTAYSRGAGVSGARGAGRPGLQRGGEVGSSCWVGGSG